MSFERVGDSWQIAVRTADDLSHVKDLDAALWAMTSLPIDSISCDPEFLAFMDDDNNGKIRVDEARRAITWLLNILKDYSGINAASEYRGPDQEDGKADQPASGIGKAG